MKNSKMAKIMVMMVIIAMATITTVSASTGADLGVGVPMPTLPTTASSSDYGIGMPTNEGLLGHLTISGFEISFPITWDVSSKSKDGGLFKILTISSPDGNCRPDFVMLSLSTWLAFTRDGVYMMTIDQPTKLIYGYGISVTSNSTKTELEILQSAHFNNLQSNN